MKQNLDELNKIELEYLMKEEKGEKYDEDNIDITAIISKNKKKKENKNEEIKPFLVSKENGGDREMAHKIRTYKNMEIGKEFNLVCKPKDKEMEIRRNIIY